MDQHIYRLGLVTATVLLSITSTIQLPGIFENWTVSAQAQTRQERKNEARRLNKLGLRQYHTGQFHEALQTFEQVLGIAKAIGDRESEAIVINNMGGVYDSLGQYPQALECYQKALTIHKEVGDEQGVGTTLNNIGALYLVLGQYSEALKYYEQALVIHKEVGNKVMEGTTLSNIGHVYDSLGKYSQALKYYEQSLVIAKAVDDKAGVGGSLNNLGAVYNNLGQYSEALKYYEQALVIHKGVGDKAGVGVTLGNIGEVYLSLKQYPEALKYLEQAVVIHSSVGNKAGLGASLGSLGEAYIHLKRYPDAEKTLFAAIEAKESLRPGLADASKIALFEKQVDTYRLLQYVLLTQNKTDTALEIAERGRARAFVELLAQRQSSNPNNSLTIKSIDLQQIRQIAKTQNATIVEYSTMENWGLLVWVVKPTGEVAFKQVDLKSLKTSLEKLVSNSRASFGVRSRGIVNVRPVQETQVTAKSRLQQLHQILIEPIAQFLPTDPNSRVIFIPQESLFLVPFAALQDEQGQYLIQKHTILTAPAIQVLELTHKARQQVSGKGVLVMGNPTMPSIPDRAGVLHQLPSLPGAETEAKAIAQLLNTQAMIGNQATKANILQQLKSVRIAHFATHGLLDDFQASGVPGALAERIPGSIALAPSGSDNGLLTSSEIFTLKLNAKLVVLSACDTGRGDIKGDGVIGLSRAFISAGVPSILVSLWAVPDAPTASLMTEFYRQIQQNPDQAKALRNAMLTTMKQHPNPKDWAAFTLIGESE